MLASGSRVVLPLLSTSLAGLPGPLGFPHKCPVFPHLFLQYFVAAFSAGAGLPFGRRVHLMMMHRHVAFAYTTIRGKVMRASDLIRIGTTGSLSWDAASPAGLKVFWHQILERCE